MPRHPPASGAQNLAGPTHSTVWKIAMARHEMKGACGMPVRAAPACVNNRHDIAIGVDIGGTAVKLGAVTAAGQIVARNTLAFDLYRNFESFARALASAIRALGVASGGEICAIGLASPGSPDPCTGVIDEGGYNVPILRERSLITALRESGLPACAVLNDGVAAAMGEHAFGAGARLQRFALVTLGTGVGGCVMIDGRPVVGRNGLPPEIGAMVLDEHGPLCGNGLAGTFEAYASAEGFTRTYAQHGGAARLSPEAIFAASALGDEAAAESIDYICAKIAQALGTMVNMLNLEACLIGGGISQAGEPLLERIAAHMPRFTWGPVLKNMSLRLAMTGNTAGLLGAAIAARNARP
eukprot:gene2046-2084_t